MNMEQIIPGEQNPIGGRYRISKVLQETATSRSYSVRVLDSGADRVLHEIIAPDTSSPDQVASTEQYLAEFFLVLDSFEHPGISRIYGHYSEGGRHFAVLEPVEGIQLQTILEMSIQPIPEAQVVQWGQELCSALHYLADRPRPFLVPAVNPTHLVVDTNGKLKLVDLGLGRLLSEVGVAGQTIEHERRLEAMRGLGRTLVLLLTRQVAKTDADFQRDRMSPGMADLLDRLLTRDESKAFTSFQDVRTALGQVPRPSTREVKTPTGAPLPQASPPDFGHILTDLKSFFQRQPVWLRILGVWPLLIAVLLAWPVLHPPVHPRQGPAAYVSCGNRIVVIELHSGRMLARVLVDHAVTALATTPDGSHLVLASPASPRLEFLDPRSNRISGALLVRRPPHRILAEPGGRALYLLDCRSAQVGRLETSPETFDQGPATQSLHVRERFSNPIGQVFGPCELAASRTPDAGLESTRPVTAVFCSSLRSHRITSLDPVDLSVRATVEVDSPGALALTPDGRTLLAVEASTGHVLTFEADTLNPGRRILLVGGTTTRRLVVSPDGQELWTLNDSGTLGVVDLSNHRLRGTVEPGGWPTAACWRSAAAGTELWVATREPDRLVAVDPKTRSVTRTFPLPAPPTDLSVVP